MWQFTSIFSYLYWGSVVVAVFYVLFSSAPVIINMQRKCIDCRRKGACVCLEYRMALAHDIEQLSREASKMYKHYKSTGWPSRFNDGIDHRLRQFIAQLNDVAEWLRYGEGAVVRTFGAIDSFCAFFNSLGCKERLREAVRRVKARRDNAPETWPEEKKVSPWERWE